MSIFLKLTITQNPNPKRAFGDAPPKRAFGAERLGLPSDYIRERGPGSLLSRILLLTYPLPLTGELVARTLNSGCVNPKGIRD